MIKKTDTKELEEKYKKDLKEFAIYYVALWNSLQSLGLNDRQTKGMIELLLNNNYEEEEYRKNKLDDILQILNKGNDKE